MLAARIQDKTIRIICSKNQFIDIVTFKSICRTTLRLIGQNQNLPIIISLENNVTLSDKASELFKKIEKCSNKTIVIIAG